MVDGVVVVGAMLGAVVCVPGLVSVTGVCGKPDPCFGSAEGLVCAQPTETDNNTRASKVFGERCIVFRNHLFPTVWMHQAAAQMASRKQEFLLPNP